MKALREIEREGPGKRWREGGEGGSKRRNRGRERERVGDRERCGRGQVTESMRL